jgi:deoxyribonuclease-4
MSDAAHKLVAMAISIGAHVEQDDPIAEAKSRETTLVQFFLGDPQGYKGPEIRYAGGAAGL